MLRTFTTYYTIIDFYLVIDFKDIEQYQALEAKKELEVTGVSTSSMTKILVVDIGIRIIILLRRLASERNMH